MLKWFKSNPQTAVILLLVGVLIFQYLFLSNSYKKEYYRLLVEQEKKYEQQIEKLHGSNDSILDLNKAIEKQIVEIDKQIAKKDAELAKLKKQNAQVISTPLRSEVISTTFFIIFSSLSSCLRMLLSICFICSAVKSCTPSTSLLENS